MKIDLEITYNQLLFLNDFMGTNLPLEFATSDKRVKSLLYLTTEVAQKLLKKTIDKMGIKKPFKLSLKYYEAYALHQFILTFMYYEPSESKRVTREILGILNQKLT